METKTITPNKFIDFRKLWNINDCEKASIDSVFMQFSIMLGDTRSTCRRKHFGAVITNHGRVVSSGYNGAPAGQEECYDLEECKLDSNGSCYLSVHAEANAIGYAARNGISLEGSTIYVKSIPCLACAKLIVASGIRRYVCIDDDYRIKDGLNYLIENKIPIDILRTEIV